MSPREAGTQQQQQQQQSFITNIPMDEGEGRKDDDKRPKLAVLTFNGRRAHRTPDAGAM
jgi:hypothetical protein